MNGEPIEHFDMLMYQEDEVSYHQYLLIKKYV